MSDLDRHSTLVMWVVYEKPSDYPESYVLRRWVVGDGYTRADGECVLGPTLEGIREQIPVGLHRLDRDDADDPVIKEIWL